MLLEYQKRLFRGHCFVLWYKPKRIWKQSPKSTSRTFRTVCSLLFPFLRKIQFIRRNLYLSDYFRLHLNTVSAMLKSLHQEFDLRETCTAKQIMLEFDSKGKTIVILHGNFLFLGLHILLMMQDIKTIIFVYRIYPRNQRFIRMPNTNFPVFCMYLMNVFKKIYIFQSAVSCKYYAFSTTFRNTDSINDNHHRSALSQLPMAPR